MLAMESERRYLSRFSFRKFGVLPAHLADHPVTQHEV